MLILFLSLIAFAGGMAEARFSLGDSKDFWVWDLNVMPPGSRKATATAQACGTKFCIFVEDKLWGTQITTSHLNRFYQALEFRASEYAIIPNSGILAMEEKIFAPLPQSIQGNDQLIVLFADLGKFKDYEFDGFFNAFDRMTDAEAWEKHEQHSNELNIIYLNGLRQNESYTLGVIAHELQHLLSPNEKELWLSEMIAEGAMLLTGYFTDQEHVNRLLQDSAKYSLVSQTYVSYGTQLLFASFLMDTFTGFGGLDDLAKMPEAQGRQAVEKLFHMKFSTPSSFDAIFSNYLGYIFAAAERSLHLPNTIGRIYPNAGLNLVPFRRQGKIAPAPSFVEGQVAPYGFALYDMDEPLSGNSDVQISLKAPAPCAEGNLLWKPLSAKTLAVFAVGCEQQKPKDSFQFRLQLSAKSTETNTNPPPASPAEK